MVYLRTFTIIYHKFMVNLGKYTIHGSVMGNNLTYRGSMSLQLYLVFRGPPCIHLEQDSEVYLSIGIIPKNPDTSKVAILMTYALLAIQVQTLPLEGPWGFLGPLIWKELIVSVWIT